MARNRHRERDLLRRLRLLPSLSPARRCVPPLRRRSASSPPESRCNALHTRSWNSCRCRSKRDVEAHRRALDKGCDFFGQARRRLHEGSARGTAAAARVRRSPASSPSRMAHTPRSLFATSTRPRAQAPVEKRISSCEQSIRDELASHSASCVFQAKYFAARQTRKDDNRRPRMTLVEEEDATPDVTAAGDRAQRGRTVEAAVDAGTAVAAEGPRPAARVGLAVGPEQRPGRPRELFKPVA